MRKTFAVLLTALGAALPAWAASGPTTSVTAFYTFSASVTQPPTTFNNDGAGPEARLLAGSDGTLYGTTTSGGLTGAGTVFSLSTAGTLNPIYAFQPFVDSDGVEDYDFGPNEVTLGFGQVLYGTTQRGSTNRAGTIFKVNMLGQEADLHDFSAPEASDANTNSDGFYPSAALVLGPDGNYYGTTQYGGTNGTGTIFQLTPSGNFTTMYSFGPSTGNSDGMTPNSLALGGDSNFYGTTQLGGANGGGTFFQFTTAGALTPLYAFGASTSDAAEPQAQLLLGPDGNFYGTSAGGGTDFAGTVFRMTLGGNITVLYSFTGGNDGGSPMAPLALGSDGNFYGVTDEGVHGTGTIFEMTTSGAFSTVYSFPATDANSDNTTGAFPSAGLVMNRDGNLYGTCVLGGANANGVIFRVTRTGFSSPFAPPAISAQPPAKVTGIAGTFVTLNVTASGVPPFTWQWVKNRTNSLTDGGDISGSAGSSLLIGPLQASDAGSYFVTVMNNNGATNSATAVVSVTADTTPPTVKIVSPLANARTNSPVLAGTAGDNARVTNVLWRITNFNGGMLLNGSATLTRGGSNWTVAVTPLPGSNTLAVQSVDSSGHLSAIASQKFFYIVTNAIGIFVGGNGSGSFGGGTASVKNDAIPANGAVLRIGEGYTITADVASGSLFSNWTGVSSVTAFTSNTAKLSFVMQSNLVLTANFTPNFFLGAHGTYNGLFSNTNAVAAESSGMLQGLALGTNGAFTAKLLRGNTPYSFAGSFNITGNYATNLGPATAVGGPLKLNMTLNAPAQEITGTVSNTIWNASLLAEIAGSNLPSSEFTFLFMPPAGAPPNVPPGDGYAAATNHLGIFTFSGKLADGAAYSQTAPESASGDIPIYSGSLYGGTGMLIGWINATTVQSWPSSTTLTWIKKAARTYPPYTNGFTNVLTLQGATYAAPAARVPAIQLPEGTLQVSNSTLQINFGVGVSNTDTFFKLAGAPTNSLTGTITAKTGVFTLTFGNGNGRATTPGTGIVMQPIEGGGGYFLGTTNAGVISVAPPPLQVIIGEPARSVNQ